MADNITSLAGPKPAVPVVASESRDDIERRRLLRIKRAIRRKTGAVCDLAVEIKGEMLIIRGRCPSFYQKQVAQHAAMTLLDGETLVNEIEVVAKPR
jgi:hypothetical protein